MTDPEHPAMSRDSAYMRRALTLARRGWGQTAPNPMVGAVVVRDGEIVGEGFHARWGGEHAEPAALRAAGERARGATVYVTLEPCAHHGKTPPCADALIAAGVARVVAAVPDPHPEAAGGGRRLADSGIAYEVGVEREPAAELNAPFLHAAGSDRPWIVLKLAVSLDGAIADARRSPGWLTGRQARREVHRMRAGADGIAVGVRTAMVDDPALTVRGVRAPRVPPRRIVFDRRAELPLHTELVRTARARPTLAVVEAPDDSRTAALRAAGIEIVTAPSLAGGVRALAERGIRSLLVEGGARLAGALLSADLVDRLVIFQAPIVLGAGALNAFCAAPSATVPEVRRLPVVERRRLGDDVMTVYAVHPAPCSQD